MARSETALAELPDGAGNITPEVADATDPTVSSGLLDRYDPQVLALAAGTSPVMRPLQEQTWETFSANWQTDVRMTFNWVREALLKPLRPGSRVIVISSAAATQRFITASARRRLARTRQPEPTW